MTVALYARRKQWPLEAVTNRLRPSKIHAAACESCDRTLTSEIDIQTRLARRDRP